jgi:putative sigma-54 modulation protein
LNNITKELATTLIYRVVFFVHEPFNFSICRRRFLKAIWGIYYNIERKEEAHMKFQIRGENIQVTEALRDYVEKKLSKLERYFETPPNSEVSVTLSVVRELQGVEVTIPLKGYFLRAEERSNDMYASIDLVGEKLERQIRKHKTKVNRKIRQEMGKDYLRMDVPSTLPFEEEDEFEVVRTKRFTLKPMDVDEAILQMNMVGHSFFVFANSDTDQVNVVYRRDDGKYGLIEPAH